MLVTRLFSIFLIVFASFSGYASESIFTGIWKSAELEVTTAQGTLKNCSSEISIDVTDTMLVMSNPVVVNCDGFTFYTETRILEITEGGVLSGMGNVRGTITEKLLEIISPLGLPDGTIIEGRTRFSVLSDNEINVDYKFLDERYKLQISGNLRKE